MKKKVKTGLEKSFVKAYMAIVPVLYRLSPYLFLR
jgi:hypothetical protein